MDDPTTVLRLITRLNIGGPAIQALMLTKEMPRFGYHSVLAAGQASPEEGEMQDPDVDVVSVPLQRSVSPFNDASAYKAIRRLVRRTEPQLVHTHMAKAGSLGRFAALRTSPDIKLVHTFHGHVLEGYFSAPVERAFVRVERWLARRSHALVAVSEEVRDALLALGIGSLDRWHVIPLGFDLDPFLEVGDVSPHVKNRLGIQASTPLVAALGRLAPIKDHATLISALSRTNEIHLAMFGDGALKADLMKLASELGMSERVHFCGWTHDVAQTLAGVDIVALTSRNEGTPVSIIEASAAGRPVVVTDVGGVRSVVTDTDTGFVVPAGDVGAIADRLERLARAPELRVEMGTRGRQRVRVRFSKQRLLSDIDSLYSDVLGRDGSRRAPVQGARP